ncbi:MAG: hypothetical protein J5892_04490 [Bacilli bacterium]|nr:hypothetical protein [Bacilli bacterium]
MREYFINALSFISSLSSADFVFFGAMIILLILILVMIYIIKINYANEDTIPEVAVTNQEAVPVNIYVEEEKKEPTDEELAIIDLDSLTNKLSSEAENNFDYDSLTEYERMQEEEAIISYDELVNKERNAKKNLEYTSELEITPDLKVKQVDINSLNEPSKKTITINVDEEETFLNTLKMLQNNL